MVTKKHLFGLCLSIAAVNANAQTTAEELLFKFQTEPDLEFLNFSEIKGSLHWVTPVKEHVKNADLGNLTDTQWLSDYDTLQPAVEYKKSAENPLTEFSTTAPAYQTNPFETPIDVSLKGPNTVGDAIGKILRYVGYELKQYGVGVDPSAALLFKKPLPPIHRRFSNVTVKEALCALIGSGYTVVVDNAIRTVSADMSPEKRRIESMEKRLKGNSL